MADATDGVYSVVAVGPRMFSDQKNIATLSVDSFIINGQQYRSNQGSPASQAIKFTGGPVVIDIVGIGEFESVDMEVHCKVRVIANASPEQMVLLFSDNSRFSGMFRILAVEFVKETDGKRFFKMRLKSDAAKVFA